MNEEKSSEKSWLERLSQTLSREPQNREELIALLRDAEQRHLIDSQALNMIEGVLQVSEMQARDIMIPRGQMIALKEEGTLSDYLGTVTHYGHSRYPMFRQTRDEVIGILLAKDLLKYQSTDAANFQIEDILRPAIFIPTSKRLDVLLKEFRQTHNHMAVVVDEYGGVAGIVTIEDVLEQIVGEIEDEHDLSEDAYIKKHSDKRYTVKGLTPIEDFNSFFRCNLPTQQFDTISGLIMNAFGHLPKRGEKTVLENIEFETLNVTKRRIRLLSVTITETIE